MKMRYNREGFGRKACPRKCGNWVPRGEKLCSWCQDEQCDTDEFRSQAWERSNAHMKAVGKTY